MKTLTDTERLALHTLGKGNKGLKESRDGVVPGQYTVDFTVHVTGDLTIAPDTTVAPTVTLPAKEMVARLLKMMGHTRSSGIKLLGAMAEEIDGLTAGAKKTLMAESGFNEATNIIKAQTVAVMGKTPRRGSVKGALSYEVTDAAPTVIVEQLEAEVRNIPAQDDVSGAVDDILNMDD